MSAPSDHEFNSFSRDDTDTAVFPAVTAGVPPEAATPGHDNYPTVDYGLPTASVSFPNDRPPLAPTSEESQPQPTPEPASSLVPVPTGNVENLADGGRIIEYRMPNGHLQWRPVQIVQPARKPSTPRPLYDQRSLIHHDGMVEHRLRFLPTAFGSVAGIPRPFAPQAGSYGQGAQPGQEQAYGSTHATGGNPSAPAGYNPTDHQAAQTRGVDTAAAEVQQSTHARRAGRFANLSPRAKRRYAMFIGSVTAVAYLVPGLAYAKFDGGQGLQPDHVVHVYTTGVGEIVSWGHKIKDFFS